MIQNSDHETVTQTSILKNDCGRFSTCDNRATMAVTSNSIEPQVFQNAGQLNNCQFAECLNTVQHDVGSYESVIDQSSDQENFGKTITNTSVWSVRLGNSASVLQVVGIN